MGWPLSPLHDHLIAGLTAGLTSTTLLFPLDLIKTHYQVYDKKGKPFKSIYQGLYIIVENEGFRGLYRGLFPAVIASGLSWGGYFFFYENSKNRMVKYYSQLEEDKYSFQKESSSKNKANKREEINNHAQDEYQEGIDTTLKSNIAANNGTSVQSSRRDSPKPLDQLTKIGCAFEAGLIMVAITNPLWLIKLRMQLQAVTSQTERKERVREEKRALKAIAAKEGVKTQLSVNSNGKENIFQEVSKGRTELNIDRKNFIERIDHSINNIKKKPYKGMLDAAITIIREEGPLALYKGVVPAILLTSHGVIQIISYEWLRGIAQSMDFTSGQTKNENMDSNFSQIKRKYTNLQKAKKETEKNVDVELSTNLQRKSNDEEEKFEMDSKNIALNTSSPQNRTTKSKIISEMEMEKKLPPIVSSLLGGCAKLIAGFSTYPYQVVKARIQQREIGNVKNPYRSTLQTIRLIFVNEGIAGFFKGVVPNVIRMAPAAGITFMVYEEVKSILQHLRVLYNEEDKENGDEKRK